MRERPIIFSSAMVRGILEGRKTITRRVIKPQPSDNQRVDFIDCETWAFFDADNPVPQYMTSRHYGIPGDRLWVREAWATPVDDPGTKKTGLVSFPATEALLTGHWKIMPSIFMPRWASRITLEIINVRVERLQEITDRDCIAEGILDVQNPYYAFQSLWDSINGKKYPWESNPWVFVISFKKLDKS